MHDALPAWVLGSLGRLVTKSFYNSTSSSSRCEMKRRLKTAQLQIRPGAVFIDPQKASAPAQVYVLSIDDDGGVRIGTTRSGASSLKFTSTWSLLQFLIDNGFRQKPLDVDHRHAPKKDKRVANTNYTVNSYVHRIVTAKRSVVAHPGYHQEHPLRGRHRNDRGSSQDSSGGLGFLVAEARRRRDP